MRRIRLVLIAMVIAVVGFVPSLAMKAQAFPSPDEKVFRAWGKDRIATSVDISSYIVPGEYVFLATANSYADALAASSIAGDYSSPVLLVERNRLRSDVAEAIRTRGATHVWIVGGEQAISGQVMKQVRQIEGVKKVNRASGANRFETAAKLSSLAYFDASTVFLVNGLNFPDALSASPAAASEEAPILMTQKDKLPPATLTEIERLNPKHLVVIGGQGVISDRVVKQAEAAMPNHETTNRYGGKNRYETAQIIAQELFRPDVAIKAVVSSGLNYPDALAAGAFAGTEEIPLLLTDPKVLSGETKASLQRQNPYEIMVTGGKAAVSDNVLKELERYIYKPR